MAFSGTRALVTGATGFIGSHLVESLVAAGATVKAFVRYTSERSLGNLARMPALFDHVELSHGDLRDPEALRSAVAGCDYVFHLGALIAIPYSYERPREVADTNIMGTLNVLEAARAAGVARIVHTSTSEVYGSAQFVPITEAHPLRGQSPYSASKIGADKLCEAYYRAFDVPVVTIRPFNTFGPRQTARAVIPTIVSQVLTQDRLTLGSASPRRDFTYVSDTVRAMLAGAMTPGVEGMQINLGTGSDISILDLAHLIMEICGRALPLELDQRRCRPEASEVDRLVSANDLARTSLGWTPTVGLRVGLERTIAWIEENQDLFRPNTYAI